MTGTGAAPRDLIETILEDNFDGLLVIDESGQVLAASRVADELLLRPGGGTLVGRRVGQVLPEKIVQTVEQVFSTGRPAEPTPTAPATLHAGSPGNELIVLYVVTLSRLDDGSGPRPVVCLTFWNETEKRRGGEELAYLATHDPLTGAYSRSELIKIVHATLAGDRRREAGLTMLVADLSRFKTVNDALGHSYGDMVLKQAVSRLRAAGIETVARLGSDVFALIQPGRPSEAEAQSFCRSLIERLVLPYTLAGHRAIIGACVGFTHTDRSGYEPEVLLRHADMALSAAKASPGNNFARFTQHMDDRLKEKQDMEVDLRQAIERGQFTITYQPQMALESGELVGVEALARWEHPVLGIVAPDKFIPAAEETGQIIELGGWVLETACRDVASWPFPTRLAVNVSPIQFELVDVVSEVRAALRSSGLPAHRLDIEITEGIFMSNAGFVTEALQRLRDLGVGIALDDFGTGYSSLSYLGRLPVDKIKIDRSFVRSLPGDAEAGAIIRAVMTLSETLNKVVIAEGIENADQAWMLRMMGCRIGQGYHFGRPRSSAEMARWFSDAVTRRSLAG
ncbi:MAG: EAL domain-containing protein [Devosia sp.]|nr:EAL domain-containing protein [Devosia sp.]